jgi:hypothetical protein
VSSKTTLIQTLQIRTGVLKNNSDSETTNNDWCLKNKTPIQTQQIRTCLLKNNPDSDTANKDTSPEK